MAGILFLENQVLIQETGFVDLTKMVNQSRHEDEFEWVKNDVVLVTTTDESDDSDFVEQCSDDSLLTLSSSDLADDATSSSSHHGPLFELSELMTHLPLKRGLSKYYEGKSESFGSLANLRRIEDLAKKGGHWSRMSKCRSYGGGKSQALSPKGKIVKTKKSTCSSSISRTYAVSSLGEMSKFVVQNHF